MLQALLIPISWLYALGVAFRHWLYDHHLLLAFSVEARGIEPLSEKHLHKLSTSVSDG